MIKRWQFNQASQVAHMRRVNKQQGNNVAQGLIGLFLFSMLSLATFQSHALDNDWYLGLGGGTSWLVPNPVDSSIDDDENSASYGSFFLGRDLGDLTSVQLQFHSLGETELTNGETIEYTAADASVLYRLYDSRDNKLNRNGFGIALYGRVGLGAIERKIDSNLPLKNDSQFYFGAGAGAEIFLFGPLALRLEAQYLERDVQIGSLSLVARFGGNRQQGNVRRPTATSTGQSTIPSTGQPTPQVTTEATTEPATESTITESPAPAPAAENATSQSGSADADKDGVVDALDECPDSRAGYPVQARGCPVINGVLSGVVFAENSSMLLPQSFEQLDFLANLLKRFPQAKIQIHSHTDQNSTPREQAIVTRGRLRTLGTYLIRQGISANRLVLRSFGGRNPLYDNSTAEGRVANNRIEVMEHF